ncbi:hypothetical protein Tco_0381126 [Tanacetum coccineum]
MMRCLVREEVNMVIDVGIKRLHNDLEVTAAKNYLKEQTLCKLKVKIYSVKRSNNWYQRHVAPDLGSTSVVFEKSYIAKEYILLVDRGEVNTASLMVNTAASMINTAANWARTISTNKLSTDRPSVSTDRQSVSTDRPFVSTDRSNTLYISAASTPTCANASESSFVYLGGKIPIDASTLPNADLPIDPNMPDLEDASNTLLND